jgi:hypothetical protein
MRSRGSSLESSCAKWIVPTRISAGFFLSRGLQEKAERADRLSFSWRELIRPPGGRDHQQRGVGRDRQSQLTIKCG